MKKAFITMAITLGLISAIFVPSSIPSNSIVTFNHGMEH